MASVYAVKTINLNCRYRGPERAHHPAKVAKKPVASAWRSRLQKYRLVLTVAGCPGLAAAMKAPQSEAGVACAPK